MEDEEKLENNNDIKINENEEKKEQVDGNEKKAENKVEQVKEKNDIIEAEAEAEPDNKKEETENIQEEDGNEELDNIIVDNENIENNDEKKNENQKGKEEEKKDEDSLSIEGEIDEFYTPKRPHKKKTYEKKKNNEYLDLLLNFVMNDKVELNYVLSGYFANVMITLLDKYPSQMLRYLYTERKDALKKILFHSNQKAFAILSLKLLNIETYLSAYKQVENNVKELIISNISFRNELVGELVKSIRLDGFCNEKGELKTGVDVEGRFAFINDIINENQPISKYLISNGDVYSHLFTILDTDLYSTDNNNNNSNFDFKYNTYGLFINLITKLLKKDAVKEIKMAQFSFDFINKEKKDMPFYQNLIISFGKILKNNFLPKKPEIVMAKNTSLEYKGIGLLSIKILELVKEMFSFMKDMPEQFDKILIQTNFCQKSIDYFFEYQWNNIYHKYFVDLFNIYLTKEETHEELTKYYFEHLKIHEVLVDYISQDQNKEKKNEDNKNVLKQKIKIYLKSGKTINSGVYPQVIDLIYKIQSISGLNIFNPKEKIELKIKNYGEFEFIKDEKSNKIIKIIKESSRIKNILQNSTKWNDITNNTVIPLIKKYESQLCKDQKQYDSDEDDFMKNKKKSIGSSDYLLQQLLNVIKRDKNPINKRFSLPVSRNDKNGNKTKIEKTSLREKLLNKNSYKTRKIFEEEDDEKNNDDTNEENAEKKDEKTENKEYNDSNYWEVKNNLPDNIKKEVDKKTNIIFNYNPITCENTNKNDISEEDELLSIAMGLEQNEKIEKNKKIKYIMPGKLKPINLKAKTNPVQNIFSSPNNENDNNNKISDEFNKLKFKKKDKINLFDENEDNNEKQKIHDKPSGPSPNGGENEENEEEEEAVVKKEEKEENDINEKEKNKKLNEKNENEDDNKKYNDVNYWGNSRYYLNEKDFEDCLKDL
jgi:hypothetical protein